MPTDVRDDRTQAARMQLLSAMLCFVPLVWYAHMYVAHEADRVTAVKWAAYACVLSLIWGPALLGIAGGLGLAARLELLGVVLGGVGSLAASLFYWGGLWAFTFRYPPHWALYATQLVGTCGAVLAVAATVRQLKVLRRRKVA